MFSFKIRAIVVLTLSIIVAISARPAGAFAAQESTAGSDGQKTAITQEYTYKEGETPNIPQKIIQFGQVFKLVSVSEPAANSSLPTSRSYTYRVPVSYTPDQLSQAPKNVRLTPVYGTGKRQVDRKETIEGLPNNDVDKLPRSKIYGDTNGRGPGANVNGELVLAEVKYEVAGRDEDGIPNNYKACVVYRGEENYSTLLYYNAVATYTDTVTEDGVKTYTVVATYEADVQKKDGIEEPAQNVSDGDGSGGANGPALDVSEGGGSDGSAFSFPFSLRTLSPLGTAAIATIIAAVLTLVFIGIYSRRRARESV